MSFIFESAKLLQPYNTFGIAAQAEYFATVDSADTLPELLNQAPSPLSLILGGGSNLLLASDIAGLVLHNTIRGLKVISEQEDQIILEIGAGENWHQLVLYCVNHGYGGIENLSLIPGTVGAAPIQNIGAYGTELASVLVDLDAYDCNQQQFVTLTNSECCFGYRTSLFKQVSPTRYIICAIRLRLTKHAPLTVNHSAITQILPKKATLRDVMQAVIAIRQQKLPDPAVLGNAGSFFKNPLLTYAELARLRQQYPLLPYYPHDKNQVKLSAAWLIEQEGWKGKRQGNVGIYAQHALVLVNYGHATGSEVLTLANAVRDSVEERFAISLQEEVQILEER